MVEAAGESHVMKGCVYYMKEFGFYPERYVLKTQNNHPTRETTTTKMTGSTLINIEASVGSDWLRTFCSREAE